jgi:predicted DNA-binding WGR domain protein
MLPNNSLTKENQGPLHGLPLRWENLATRRYYSAIAQQNLFSEWEVFCVWGGIGTRLGNSKVIPATGFDDAQEKLLTLSNRRIKRHYRRVKP